MRHVVASLLVGVLLLVPSDVPAQSDTGSFRLVLSPSLQLQGFSRLGGVAGTLYGGVLSGSRSEAAPAQERRLDVDVGASSGPRVALSAEWHIGGAFVLGAVAGRQETSLDLDIRTARPDGSDVQHAAMDELGRFTVWTGSVGLQWRLAAPDAPIRPFLGLSAGASHWIVAELDRGPLRLFVNDDRLQRTVRATLPAGAATAGVDVPLGQRFRLRLEISDHVTLNPWGDRSLRMASSFEGTGSAAEWVHGLRGGVGLGLRLF